MSEQHHINPSQRRLEANRRNAQMSTGPRTPEGKARVAQNRTTHGLTGAHTILPGEDAEAFDRLRATLMDEHAPATETEAHQVELLAHNQWKLRRAARMEVEALEKSAPAEGGPVSLTDEVMRVSRYTASIRRSYTLALAELRRLQTDRNRSNPISANFLKDDLLRELRRVPQRSEPPHGPEEVPSAQLNPFSQPETKIADTVSDGQLDAPRASQAQLDPVDIG